MERGLSRAFGATILIVVFVAAGMRAPAADAGAQEATPAAGYSCEEATPMAGTDMGTPMAGMDMPGTAVGGTPMAGMAMETEFDQVYIDMMIPHHQSIIAMAQAALPRLRDERLKEIAQAIVATQEPEIAELRGYRERFYGDAEPMPMDAHLMGMMDEMMPGVAGSPEEMAAQMDPDTQVATVCAAEDADLAFIDLTIPHHRGAIVASEAALDRAVHPEIQDFARRVIAAQEAEIKQLDEIRRELYGSATPVASPIAGGQGAPIVDQSSLIDALRAEGLTVDVAGSLVPDVPFPNAQTGTVLRVSGGALAQPIDVQVYEYADPSTAAADAGQILPDGNLPTAMITWIGPPHFFRSGRIVALYVGTDQAAIGLMTDLLGPQFAGR